MGDGQTAILFHNAASQTNYLDKYKDNLVVAVGNAVSRTHLTSDDLSFNAANLQ